MIFKEKFQANQRKGQNYLSYFKNPLLPEFQ